MPPWLLIWIARLGSGERFRNATPADWRFHCGFFVLLPVFVIAGTSLLHSFFNHAGAVLVWPVTAVAVMVFAAAGYFWARIVPAVVSLVLGILAWGAFAWFSWHHS